MEGIFFFCGDTLGDRERLAGLFGLAGEENVGKVLCAEGSSWNGRYGFEPLEDESVGEDSTILGGCNEEDEAFVFVDEGGASGNDDENDIGDDVGIGNDG